MKHKLLSLGVAATALVLIGGGCNVDFDLIEITQNYSQESAQELSERVITVLDESPENFVGLFGSEYYEAFEVAPTTEDILANKQELGFANPSDVEVLIVNNGILDDNERLGDSWSSFNGIFTCNGVEGVEFYGEVVYDKDIDEWVPMYFNIGYCSQ
jgi:hypothetical protein